MALIFKFASIVFSALDKVLESPLVDYLVSVWAFNLRLFSIPMEWSSFFKRSA